MFLVKTFQFYDSTIKRAKAERIEGAIKYFNSTIVRLKVPKTYAVGNELKNFNSTIVRLKGSFEIY